MLQAVCEARASACWLFCKLQPADSCHACCACRLSTALAVMSRGMRPEIPQHTPAGLAALMQVRVTALPAQHFWIGWAFLSSLQSTLWLYLPA